MRPAREEPGFSVEAGAQATPAPLSRAPAGWQADPGKRTTSGGLEQRGDPIDHHGEFYDLDGALSRIRCHQQPRIPVYGGGGSQSAIDTLAPHLDVFMLWGEPLAATADFMARVRTAAGDNPVTFSLSTRPVLADTEGKAWDQSVKTKIYC